MNVRKIEAIQRNVCLTFGALYVSSPFSLKVGISPNVREGITPINGLRHSPTGDTTGWYIWAGNELSEGSDFFKPLHVAHVDEWCPSIMQYLGLAPGWRFLVDRDYEDVWYDESLLRV